MKKRNVIICSAISGILILTSGVYASQNISLDTNNANDSEIAQFQEVLEDSNVLKSRYEIVERTDIENGDSEIHRVAPHSLSQNTDNAIKIYNVQFSSGMTSLAELLNKDNEVWMVPKLINNEMSFVYIKKGDSIEVASQKINALNVSDEWKQKMIANASKKAGKWYVNRVDEQSSLEAAQNFVNNEYIVNKLNEFGISEISDIKYIGIDNNRTLGLWVKSGDSEYVIPYVSKQNSDSSAEINIYTLTEFISTIVQ